MTEIPSSAPVPQHQKLLGSVEYRNAVIQVLEQAQRRIKIFESILGEPYNTLQCEATLRRFLLANPQNRLHIVVHDAQALTRDCPRILRLLQGFSHNMAIHATHSHAKTIYDPFVLADDSHYVHRFHFDDTRGLLAFDDPQSARALVERFDALWEASDPAASATTLGL